MTTIHAAFSSRQNTVFSSVFPQDFKIPRPRLQPSVTTAEVEERARKQLTADSQLVLGIKDEKYVYSVRKSRHAYRPFFTKCATLQHISTPSANDRLDFSRKLSRLQSVMQVSTWTQTIESSHLKQIFARVIDQSLTDLVHWAYAGTYNEEVRRHLHFWVEHILLIWIKFFLHTINHGSGSGPSYELSEDELQKWQDKASGRLANLRIDELFDIIVDWDKTTAGIDDIKPFLTNALNRTYLTTRFSNTLQTRLLHPGASTIEILQVYISTIRAFRHLDPRGVLLERVARRIRQYLREREDTIKVVVEGLLSNISDYQGSPSTEQQNPNILTELAWELQNRQSQSNKENVAYALDWNNMEWLPDPIDAAPDYRRSSKHTDVIGSIISLFESKEVFVKELQQTLAERLLRSKDEYDQEMSVIEHLKIRFGDAALQACEVMLRDVLDSRRLDSIIRRDQNLNNLDVETEPNLHAKVLSRLFWPSLPGAIPIPHDEDDETPQFKPPLLIIHQRTMYEKGFEALKQMRKLTWNDNLGQVEIELTFADGRTYQDEVLPYQAAVIYTFNDDSSTCDTPTARRTSSKTIPKHSAATRTVDEISRELNLSNALTRSACLLFVSKRVLTQHPTQPDTFSVLEHLPPDAPTSTSTSAPGALSPSHPTTSTTHHEPQQDVLAAQTEAASARQAELAAQQALKAAEAQERKQKMALYHQFIISMLTNQGAMPLPRIAMMLGIVVPGGFPFSNEELREMLGAMVRDAEIGFDEAGGGRYKKAG